MHPLIEKLGKPLTKELMDYIIIDGTLEPETVNELFYKHKKLKTRKINHVFFRRSTWDKSIDLRIFNDAGKKIVNMYLTEYSMNQIMEELKQT